MAASRANRLRLCWRPTQQRLTDRLQRYEQLDYTYVEVGATCAASLPAGYHHIDHSTIAGTGHKTFALLAKALWGWQLQRCAGLVVATSHDTVTIGVTVLNAIPGRPGLVAPCRVVDVVDDHRRRGFSYGTLPGHPLRGEERFTVEFDAAGRVVLHIVSFSVPTGLARLAPPVARLGQRALNGRYAAAACRIVAPPGRPLPAPPTHDRLTLPVTASRSQSSCPQTISLRWRRLSPSSRCPAALEAIREGGRELDTGHVENWEELRAEFSR